MAGIKNLLFVLCLSFFLGIHAELLESYYGSTCPDFESIVNNATKQILDADESLAPSFLRLFFHDAFVLGTDASVLLNSTANNTAEKDAPLNSNLRGFAQIDQIKAAVEAKCPRTVSCADILALVARISVVRMGGILWPLAFGRKDGLVSLASLVSGNLPHTSNNISQLIANFASKDLNSTDLAVLSGGHTFGVSHCSTISSRLYNSTGGISIDPTLNSTYAPILISECPFNSTTNVVNLDRITPTFFDFEYYVDIIQNASLFHSDAALLDDPTTSSYVLGHTSRPTDLSFLRDFADSMLKMSNILNPATGQVRLNCAVLNSS